jgi:hypothetical protein
MDQYTAVGAPGAPSYAAPLFNFANALGMNQPQGSQQQQPSPNYLAALRQLLAGGGGQPNQPGQPMPPPPQMANAPPNPQMANGGPQQPPPNFALPSPNGVVRQDFYALGL